MIKKISQSTAYWAAFIILGLWASFAFYTMDSLISSQQKFGKLINLSGKQRMLSQKTSLHAHIINQHGSTDNKLKELLALMHSDHSFISSNLTSKTLHDFYFKKDGLDSQVKHYLRLQENFLLDRDPELLNEITDYSFILLKNLDKAVGIFEDESNKVVADLKQRELYIYIGTWLTLILEALIIILPMIRTQNKYMHNLENEVQKRTKDIEIFAKIFNNSNEGMVITDADEEILNVNNAFTNITGYSKKEVIGKNPKILQSHKHNKKFYEKMWSDIESKNIWQGEIINKTKDGQEVNEHLTIMKLKDNGSYNYVSVFSDISERKRQEELLEFLATHDNLTNLFNRNEIIIRINFAIHVSKKEFAVIFIDLDNFKVINDSMGHTIGDKLLIDVSKRIRSITNSSDSLARLGGDEFVVLLETSKSKKDDDLYISKLIQIFSTPFIVEDKELYITASIGVVYSSSQKNSATSLLKKADLAMYSAKDKGKNKAVFYTKDLEEKMNSKLLVENQLRKAIENDELELYYQAKVNFKDSFTYAAEVLLRWNKDGEVIMPDNFIPIAEETNLIKKIDKWVIKKSVEKIKEIHSLGYMDFYLAVNISGHSFSDEKTMDEILNIIKQSKMAKCIELEITEGALINNIDIATKHLEKIKAMGIAVSLDDFGTGYSSFSYLSQMNVDVLKIDRSFIMNLESEKQEVIVKAIISFSNNLGIRVVAEGVETHKQAEWLKKHGCDYGQGYLYSKPIPFNEFIELLSQNFKT